MCHHPSIDVNLGDILHCAAQYFPVHLIHTGIRQALDQYSIARAGGFFQLQTLTGLFVQRDSMHLKVWQVPD